MDFLDPHRITAGLSSGSAWVLLACFGAGLASSFTPCIYPLIPVTIGILGSRQSASKGLAFLLTLAYVLGIATTYAALGLLAALTGSLFGEFSANPWLLLGIGAVILALALNMLDVYSIRLGNFGTAAAGERRSGFLSNYAYGLTFGLIASPCTAPPLAAILTWVGSTHSLVAGPLSLFAFSLGMGTVLLIIGTFSSSLTRLPKSGMWMVHVKKAMGVMMVIMAGYFVFQAGRQW